MDTATSPVIVVTEAAAVKARALAERDGRPQAALRVRVTAGGCSGFSYELTLEDAPAAGDHVVQAPNGLRVLIDPSSVPIVSGSTLEFNESMMGGGLKMVNPQAKHECACGESFSL
ncbi:MAG TPA: iron-sulfur cluster assembly accessory protein [Actinomycetota bacterium]|jgi:iron-sulfur cluster assembly accessory protein|nr:iron-sulfur cluster assembly accessory protein [Actinomycetota bacterium]